MFVAPMWHFESLGKQILSYRFDDRMVAISYASSKNIA